MNREHATYALEEIGSCMNWLAHLYLSDHEPAFYAGSILPDMVSMNVLKALPEPFQGGIERHRQIDLFTDSHPAFRRSVSRFSLPLRRFGGILVDVIYDHCLARRWSAHSEVALTEFTARVYASLDSIWADIPVQARPGLAHMRLEDWLGSYRELSGIARALERISRRMKRPFDSSAAMAVFEQQHEAFDQDFHVFFPELKLHLGLLREVQPPSSAMS